MVSSSSVITHQKGRAHLEEMKKCNKKRVKVKELKRSIQVSIDITDIFKRVLKDAVEQQ